MQILKQSKQNYSTLLLQIRNPAIRIIKLETIIKMSTILLVLVLNYLAAKSFKIITLIKSLSILIAL